MVRPCRLIPFLLPATALLAAPKLRLSTAAVGPVSLAIGAAGPSQTGLASSIGASRSCTTRAGACFPVNVLIPADAPKGSSVPLYLFQGPVPSNRVAVAIE